jgi:hypothetical protein
MVQDNFERMNAELKSYAALARRHNDLHWELIINTDLLMEQSRALIKDSRRLLVRLGDGANRDRI